MLIHHYRCCCHRFCLYTGQQVNYMSSRITVFASGFKFIGTLYTYYTVCIRISCITHYIVTGVKPLPEEEALKAGIDFLAEGACTYLVYT